MSLIVIEGLDGSGKATQTKLLCETLSKTKEVKHISFPDYDCPSSALVKMYLSGEFGNNPGDVNAFAASAFYAVDRFASFKKFWEKDYNSDTVIISDRYTTSNMIYQGEKMKSGERKDFFKWVEDFEYQKLSLPKPDAVIYLDMDPAISQKLLSGRYDGNENKKDIHEKNVEFLTNCRECALEAALLLNWKVIKCFENNEPLTINSISEKVLAAAAEAI